MPGTVYKPKAGDTAVITGAGYGGIGYAVAELLASRFKVHVVLVDRDPDALEQASKALVIAGIPESDFETRLTDVSDPDEVLQLANAVYELHGKVDFLHLNAGVSAKVKAYGQDIVDEWQNTFAVNLFGVVNATSAFVDRMIAQVRFPCLGGHAETSLIIRESLWAKLTPRTWQDSPAAVVITGSKQGITNPPGTSAAYNASKAVSRPACPIPRIQLL